MWTIIKYKKRKYPSLLIDLKKKLGTNSIIYKPKILVKNKKGKSLEINLLGDYLFLFDDKLSDNKFINSLKYCRGLKFILEGYYKSQNEIQKFIERCKSSENEKGYLSRNIFEIFENKKYKFFNGPFSNYIFEIINLQKNKLKIQIGNWQAEIANKELLYHPI